jgi:hypothetical protein
MAELLGGTTIGGYTALHSGLKEASLVGNLKIGGNVIADGIFRFASGQAIQSGYNNGNIIHDHSNGNIALNAAGTHLLLGWERTTGIRINTNLLTGDGATTIADKNGKLYYQGNDIDTRYINDTDTYVSTDLAGSTDYPRLVAKNSGATTPAWIRLGHTDGGFGILPYSNGSTYIGTSGWRFKEIHGVTFYENGTSLASKYAASGHNHDGTYVKYSDNVLVDDGAISSVTQDWNTLGTGLREVGNGTAGWGTTGTQPLGAYGWGTLLTSTLTNSRFQLYAPHTGTDSVKTNNNSIYVRTGWGVDWKPWVRLLDNRGGEIGSLALTPSSTEEGGEIQLQPGTTYSELSYIDRWQDNIRIWTGTGPQLLIPKAGDMVYAAGLKLSGRLTLQGKLAINGDDGWLRINDTGAFTAGIYMGNSIVRTDGHFRVGGGNTYTTLGKSQITFGSEVNPGSDYGYIRYDYDNNGYAYWGDTNENSALVIGVENDGKTVSSDVVVLQSAAAVVIDAPDTRMIGDAFVKGYEVLHKGIVGFGTSGSPSGGYNGNIYIQI